ncbi:MAG: twin-arginine translocase subunit TatC [Bacteroidota bacterium]
MAEEQEMSFLEHLEELRFKLMRSVIAIFVVAIVLFIAKDFVFDTIIFGPRKTDFISYRAWCKLSHLLGLDESLCTSQLNFSVINTTLMGKFTAHLMVSIIGGIIVAFPYIFYQFWSFVKPGLRQNEAHAVRGITFFTALLFFSGVLFGYFGIVPLSLQFLGNYELADVESKITIMSYMKTVATITLASGLVFQLPIVIYFLSKVGLVTPATLRSYRKHALVVNLVLAAIITPPDITSQVMVAIPVLFLYEISIYISARVEKGRLQKQSTPAR